MTSSQIIRCLGRSPTPGIRGPDVYARVSLDVETGEVLDLLGG